MLRYVIRRLLLIIPTMFFVALITFSLAHLAPGSPFDKNPNRPLPEETIAHLERYFGVDKPIPEQFVIYIGNLLRGDLGASFVQRGRPVVGCGSWDHTVMPTFVLALGPGAFLTRITRASMLEAIRQDYVRTARSKGLREQSVIVGHALKNALIPVATIIGPATAGLI